MSYPLCDFCGIKDVHWVYPAINFRHSPQGESVGDWRACAECHSLIQNGERDKLSVRSYEQIKEHVEFPPELRVSLQKEIKELHDMFFAHQSGLPRRYVYGCGKPITRRGI